MIYGRREENRIGVLFKLRNKINPGRIYWFWPPRQNRILFQFWSSSKRFQGFSAHLVIITVLVCHWICFLEVRLSLLSQNEKFPAIIGNVTSIVAETTLTLSESWENSQAFIGYDSLAFFYCQSEPQLQYAPDRLTHNTDEVILSL